MGQTKQHDAYDETPLWKLTPEERKNIIKTRWVLKRKPNDDIRTRLVAQDYNMKVADKDDIYASTPGITTLKILLTQAVQRGWEIVLGDISAAFLHAPLDKTYYVLPPIEYYPQQETVWKLKKAL